MSHIPFKERTAALSININKYDLDKWADWFEKVTVDVGYKSIREFLEDVVLPYAKENHPWRHRTYTLREGHYIARARNLRGEFSVGYDLVADPYRNPQTDPRTGKTKVVTFDYAYWLVNWGGNWLFWAVIDNMDDLVSRIAVDLESEMSI